MENFSQIDNDFKQIGSIADELPCVIHAKQQRLARDLIKEKRKRAATKDAAIRAEYVREADAIARAYQLTSLGELGIN